MTFKDLLEQFSFDEIAPAFKTLWQRNAPEQAARLDMEGWREIYHSIQEIKPVHSPYYIRLGYRWESCVPMIDMNCAVYAKEDNGLCYPLSNHSHWAESIGMEIVVEEDVKITAEELAAGLLWEITYYGGTEAMSNENQERIFNRNKNANE